MDATSNRLFRDAQAALAAKEYLPAFRAAAKAMQQGTPGHAIRKIFVSAAAGLGRYQQVLDSAPIAAADGAELTQEAVDLLTVAVRESLTAGQDRAASHLLAPLVRDGKAGFRLVFAVIRRGLAAGAISQARALLSMGVFRDDEQAVLQGMIALAVGNTDRAEALLQQVADGSPVRQQATSIRRELYRVLDEGEKLVAAGLEELAIHSGPNLRLALGVARDAENFGLEGPAHVALTRAAQDAVKIAAQPVRSRKDFHDLIRFHLVTLDLRHARLVLYQAMRECASPTTGALSSSSEREESSFGQLDVLISHLVELSAPFADEFEACSRLLLARLGGDASAMSSAAAGFLAPRPSKRFTVFFPSKFFEPEPDSDRTFLRSFQRKFLFEAMRRLKEADFCLDLRPHFARARELIWHESHPCLAYHTYGTSANAFHFKEGDLPYLYYLDRGGYSGWSELSKAVVDPQLLGDFTDAQALAYLESERERSQTGNESKLVQLEFEENLSLPTPYVFVAMQTVNDSVQAHAHLKTMDLAQAVVDRFRDSGYTVVIKRHPWCKDPRVTRLLKTLVAQSHVVTSALSIHQLIPGCEAVFTVNSGVGSEALFYEKPVYVTGSCDYRHVCHEVHSVEELVDKTSPLRLPVSRIAIARFLYYYRMQYFVDARDDERLGSELVSRLRLG